jgi:hypothetical protein
MAGPFIGEWIEHQTLTYLYRYEFDQSDDTTTDQTASEEQDRDDSALQKAEIKRSVTPPRKIRPLDLRVQFNRLAEIWKRDTAHLSNITRRAMHPAYQRIIGMGSGAVPLILEEFRKGQLDDWFWALSAITGENPITADLAGNVEGMAEAWLRWGRATGYLNDSTEHLRPDSQTSE